MLDRYLPDTNILSAYLKQEHLIIQRFREIDYYLSSIVLGELYRWAFGSVHKAERLMTIRDLSRFIKIAAVDNTTSEYYGRLVNELERTGSGVSVNNIWIAAQALQHNLIVISRDTDFDRIPQLKIEKW